MRIRWVALGMVVVAAPAWAGDKDGDGNPNKTDNCKEQPEDMDGFEDEDGCPDPDNDGDGIDDDIDKCPDAPEDLDGHQDEDGCADPDNDEDGVLDADDQCPGEDENDDDGDGCPTISLAFLSGDGRLAAISALNGALLEAVGQKEEGCPGAATFASDWLSMNDAGALAAQWEARLARGPEAFDKVAAQEVLDQKGGLYPTLKPALDIFCKDHGGWQGVAAQIEAVYTPWMTPSDPE